MTKLINKSKKRNSGRLQDKTFNVLHVISKLPVGGVENMLSKVIRGYDKERFNVSVCCIKEGGEIADELKRSGDTVQVLNRMKGRGFDWKAVGLLHDLIKKEKIHILRTHQYHANLYGRIAGILAGVPIMIPSFHNLYTSPNKPKLHRRVFNYLLAYFSDALIAVSNSVALDIVRFDRINHEKIKIIYNGIVLEKFNSTLSKEEAKIALGLPLDCKIIGTVGRLTVQKGHHYLIEAVSGLTGACVAIAGDGHLLKELKKVARQYEVNCIFMGQVSPERIPLFLRALDIFCFPSLWEGFATALAEAMAAGLPVVVTDIPPLREVLDDAGIFIPPGDTEEFAKTLKILIDNTSLRDSLGKKAKERARFFSIDTTVKACEALFEEALKKKELL